MHPQLEQFIDSQSKLDKMQAKALAQGIDKAIPESQEIIALHKGTRYLHVLTPTALYWTNGGKTTSLQLKAITAVNQKAVKTVVETSTEKIELKPGYNKWLRPDMKTLNDFAKKLREAL